jgi:preprotein translocase subunit SecA
MRIFGGERIAGIMSRLKIEDEIPIENRIISKSLESAQKKVEGFNFDMRKNVVEYDDVMNRHRKATYVMRREILHQAEISGRIKEFIKDEARTLVASPESIQAGFDKKIAEVFPLSEEELDRLFNVEASKFEKELAAAGLEIYNDKKEQFGEAVMQKVERDIYLQVLDNLWMQHLENMDHLREGIHWISVGQRDPLVEYRRQGQHLFEKMQQDLRRETLVALFSAEPASIEDLDEPIETELTRAARQSVDNADKIIQVDEFEETDFVTEKNSVATANKKHNAKKKSRKQERTRKKSARKRK